MTTDYHNLTFFEMAAVSMIAIGIALVGFQVFIALPDSTQAKLSPAFQVFEMSEAVQEVWNVQIAANDFVFEGMGEFYSEFYVAVGEVALPVADDISKIADNFSKVANTVARVSDHIALGYQNNNAAPGVEAGLGGKVMGAYFQKLSE